MSLPRKLWKQACHHDVVLVRRPGAGQQGGWGGSSCHRREQGPQLCRRNQQPGCKPGLEKGKPRDPGLPPDPGRKQKLSVPGLGEGPVLTGGKRETATPWRAELPGARGSNCSAPSPSGQKMCKVRNGLRTKTRSRPSGFRPAWPAHRAPRVQPRRSLCREQKGAPQSAVTTKGRSRTTASHLSDWRGAVGAAKAPAQPSTCLRAFRACAVSNEP